MSTDHHSSRPDSRFDRSIDINGSEGTGMLSKQGVKEALSQMGMDSSAEAVEQVTESSPLCSAHCCAL
jgi:hypothetical protein